MKHLVFLTAVVVVAGAAAPTVDRSPTFEHGDAPGVVETSVGVLDTAGLQSPSIFLGFQLGEERRYVLGPPQELYAGENGMWSIRLRETLGDPPEGIFELTHLWQFGARRSELPIGTIVQIESEGELRVNRYGFPLELRFETKRVLAGWGEEAYTVRYRFEDGEFLKHTAMEGNDLEHVVSVMHGPEFDLSGPIGIYALVPTGVDCSLSLPIHVGQAAAVVPQKLSPGSGGSAPIAQPPLRFADNSVCREQLFGNPGLISLMLPVLWEEGTGEHEYALLTPAGFFGVSGLSGGIGGGGLNVVGGSSFDHQRAVSSRTNSDVGKLRYIERVGVEIGGRTEEAWLFEGMRAFDRVYVDDAGVVLRVDLDAAGWYGMSLGGTTAGFDPSRLDTRDLWVRLLYPSEY